MSKLQASVLMATGAQVLLQSCAEHLIDQRQGLAVVPEYIVATPKGARCLKGPAHSRKFVCNGMPQLLNTTFWQVTLLH